MSKAVRRRRVGLVGFGFIGRSVYERIAGDAQSPLEIAFVHNRSSAALAGVPENMQLHDLSRLESCRPDLVVEMSHPSCTVQWGETILRSANYLPLSVTALADDALRERLVRTAAASGTTLAVPHGALMGLDSLREWRHAWEEVTITFIKHVGNIDWSASGIDPSGVRPGDVVYDGPVRGIAPLYPRNVNTMVTCALATVGLDRCRGRLVVSDRRDVAIADIVARGRDGSVLTMRKEQPAKGVSGTELVESQYASLLRAAGVSEPLSFV